MRCIDVNMLSYTTLESSRSWFILPASHKSFLRVNFKPVDLSDRLVHARANYALLIKRSCGSLRALRY